MFGNRSILNITTDAVKGDAVMLVSFLLAIPFECVFFHELQAFNVLAFVLNTCTFFSLSYARE